MIRCTEAAMSTAARARSDEAANGLHPTAWLVAPTVALLFGQAVASWAIAPGALLALPLPSITLHSGALSQGVVCNVYGWGVERFAGEKLSPASPGGRPSH